MFRTFLIALVFLTGCTLTQRRDTEKAVAQTLISDEQEFQLGFQVHEELKKQNIKFMQNPTVELYVEQIAKKLTTEANKERTVEWRTYVIDDPNTVNAFGLRARASARIAARRTSSAGSSRPAAPRASTASAASA